MERILYKVFVKGNEIKENKINYFLMIQSFYPNHPIFPE